MRPPVPVTPLDPLDKEFLRESVKELLAIMSSEWVEEAELSSEEIQIGTPSLTIQCKICGIMVDILYNPTVRANLMSTSFASTYLGNEPIAPTIKSYRVTPRTSLEGLGILHNISLYCNNAKIAQDFHVFDFQDFDIMIGHPLENLFIEPPMSWDLDIKLGRETFSIPIT